MAVPTGYGMREWTSVATTKFHAELWADAVKRAMMDDLMMKQSPPHYEMPQFDKRTLTHSYLTVRRGAGLRLPKRVHGFSAWRHYAQLEGTHAPSYPTLTAGLQLKCSPRQDEEEHKWEPQLAGNYIRPTVRKGIDQLIDHLTD